MIWILWTLLAIWLLAEADMRLFDHRCWENNKLVWRLKINALTFGRHILVGPGHMNTRTLSHERAHVDQFRRYTIPGFMLLYAFYQLRYGYQGNPLEAEAKSLADLISG